MSRPRLLVHQLYPSAAYHVVSRVVNRDKIFGTDEKRVLAAIMRRFERFCCVRVLTYCLMGNHFHLLVQVEERPADADSMSDAELVERYRLCHGDAAANKLQMDMQSMLSSGLVELHAAMRARLLKRMWNLSAFVQSVKQGFSIWYNHKNERKGTLWEERFKSVIAMGPEAVASIAAYIDLNPVRAGLVEDPADYEWSGYGEAMRDSGRSERSQHARLRLKAALVDCAGSLLSSADAQEHFLEWYRCWIYRRGVSRGLNPDGSPIKAGFDVAEALEVAQKGGQLPSTDQLKRTVRHFCDGLVLGTRSHLEAVFSAKRDYFSEKRKSGARKMRWGEWGELRAMRDLQLNKSADPTDALPP
jgi:putative transposase